MRFQRSAEASSTDASSAEASSTDASSAQASSAEESSTEVEAIDVEVPDTENVGVDVRGAGSTGAADTAPLALGPAVLGLAGCVARTGMLLLRRRIHLPRQNAGRQLEFADGSRAVVYRETVLDQGDVGEPAVLIVGFRLRLLRGRAHRLFRVESIFNTPLFVGFPGYVSKLWLTHDENGLYRGVYDWDGPHAAETYARTLWRVLALGSVPGSIRFRVLPGVRRDEYLRDPGRYAPDASAPMDWWRPVQPISAQRRVREPV